MNAARILVVGGYGTFGGRLVQLLADETRLTLIVAGRSREKADAFCASLTASATVVPLAFDRDGDVEQQLRAAHPDLVVDASGPFQAYGGDAHGVVRACLALGIGYLDIADSSEFVRGISRFDADAKARGIFVLTGASTYPVLTAAAVRRLAQGMTRLDPVATGIAPSPHAGLRLSVIRAIASYAGRPVRLLRGGRAIAGHALIDARHYTIAPPGRLPLYPGRFSLVDVPDLEVLPALWPQLRSVWVGAGPTPGLVHRVLNVLAWGRRLRLLPPLAPFATLMYRASILLRWGEHRGGMFVALDGADAEGRRVERSWHMIAEGDDGPFIPSMAAAAIIGHWLDGRGPSPGARVAAHDITLADYETLFARRNIFSGIREEHGGPLYRRLLGDAYATLPAPIQAMHALDQSLTARGRADIDRGEGFFARFVATLFGFPAAGRDVPVTVEFRLRDSREIWRRDFAGRTFASTQEEGRGRFDRLMCERFGPFAFGIALVCEGERLRLVVRRWTLLGVPLPLAWSPIGNAHESVADGCFRFHVELKHPWLGLLVRYRGWLEPV